MDILFAFPGYQAFTQKISKEISITKGEVTIRCFPDGESYLQLQTDIRDKRIGVVCGLDHADQKALPLLFFATVAKEMGAKQVGLIAPYLGYMRQDTRFHPGEAITSRIFAQFLSSHFDWLITIDPHLHRYKFLNEIYSIPCIVLHSADLIANWIKENVKKPLLIGPDTESRQWVAQIASKVDSPFIILTKTRHGDKDVDIDLPSIDQYKSHTPVLVDDIISSAITMIKATYLLHDAGMQSPVCIAIHPVFAEDAYTKLTNSGVGRIVTCNTIQHPSNEIDVSGLLAKALKKLN